MVFDVESHNARAPWALPTSTCWAVWGLKQTNETGNKSLLLLLLVILFIEEKGCNVDVMRSPAEALKVQKTANPLAVPATMVSARNGDTATQVTRNKSLTLSLNLF